MNEAAIGPASAPDPSPTIHTYHCICMSLILATTYDLDSLPRRKEPALDKAIILPLPTPESTKREIEDVEKDLADSADGAAQEAVDVGYSLLISTTQDRKPIVIRKEDGFERRTLLRCGRCKLVIGYRLDTEHHTDKESVKVVYLLPGGFSTTEEMKGGKQPTIPGWAVEGT